MDPMQNVFNRLSPALKTYQVAKFDQIISRITTHKLNIKNKRQTSDKKAGWLLIDLEN